MDTVRSTNPVTFMSNMLYACSILYKTKLPFIVAMNKIDVVDNKYAVEWMEDFEVFQVKLIYVLPNQGSYKILNLYRSNFELLYIWMYRKHCKPKDLTFQILHNLCPWH